MTEQEKIELTKVYIGEDNLSDEIVSSYLSLASDMIIRRLYPFREPPAPVLPSRWETLACELASRVYLRRGAEGETVHIENGIHRTFRSTDFEDLLKYVTPYAEVL